MQAEKLFKAFADESRLKIVAALLTGPKFVEQLAGQLNISVSTVSFHLKKLQSAGVVRTEKQQYYQVYYIDKDLINSSLAALIPKPPEIDTGEDAFACSVKAECFTRGRVEKLPVQVKKREVVYKTVAQRFKQGKGYTHGEMNVAIADVIDDFVTAKKEMLEMGLLIEKGDKIYVAPDKIR